MQPSLTIRPALAGLLLAVLSLLVAGCQNIPDPAVRYIAFGDSTTAGQADRQYWEFLRDDLDLPADSFAGQGQGGEDTEEGLARLRSLLEDDLYPNAQVLLYWQGGSDLLKFLQARDPLVSLSPAASDYPFQADLQAALDRTQANIELAIQAGQAAGLQVYVATYYYISPDTPACKPAFLNVLLPAQAERVNEYMWLLNDRIRNAAAAGGAVLVDVETRAPDLLANPGNYSDCNHLSDAGNRIVADLFRAAIQPSP